MDGLLIKTSRPPIVVNTVRGRRLHGHGVHRARRITHLVSSNNPVSLLLFHFLPDSLFLFLHFDLLRGFSHFIAVRNPVSVFAYVLLVLVAAIVANTNDS